MLSDPATYTPSPTIDLMAAHDEVQHIIDTLEQHNFIKSSQANFLSRCSPRTPHFYGLVKVHKKDNPLRPIVSQIDSPAYKLNKYLDYLLTTAEKSIPNLLQDTTSFLQTLHSLPPVQEGTLLYTIDVTSLYTVLPHKLILSYVIKTYKESLESWCTPDIIPIPHRLLRTIISIVLKQTFFTFNDQCYTQNYGITMGAPSSVKLANITLYQHLLYVTEQYTHTLPLLQVRYIDDIFGLFLGGLDSLKQWVQHLNNSHDTIKFTMEASPVEIPFLDTLVYIQDSIVKTKLYIKPTDKKQYLLYSSEHVHHIKKAIPYSQALRFRRIIVDDAIFQDQLHSLASKFRDRSYPTSLINTAIDRAKKLDRLQLLNYNTHTNTPWQATPFVITYSNSLISNPRLNIHKILHQAWTDLTLLFPSLLKINSPKVVFKKCTTISNLVVSNKFPPKLVKSPFKFNPSTTRTLTVRPIHTCRPCNSPRCFTCLSFHSSSSFTSTSFCHSHHLKFSLSCPSFNLIYLITCKRCGMQYVGETSTTLRERVNNHRSCIRLKMDTAVSIHFNSPLHSFEDFAIMPIEQLQDNSKSLRLQRETFYILLLGTTFPRGINGFPIAHKLLLNQLTIHSQQDVIQFVARHPHILIPLPSSTTSSQNSSFSNTPHFFSNTT